MESVVAQKSTISHKYNGNHSNLIALMHTIQSEHGYLPEQALKEIAKKHEIPLIQIYSLATFFKAFSLEPRGKHKICVCMGTACHVRGSQSVLDEMTRCLGIEPGETTEDMQYTLETVNCLGACAMGPVVVANENYHGNMNAAKVKKVLP